MNPFASMMRALTPEDKEKIGDMHSVLRSMGCRSLKEELEDRFEAVSYTHLDVYKRQPLEKDVVITGDLTASLFISSDAPDTDFMVRLTDVDENGRSIKLADGILSARYRNGFDHAEFLTPGEVVNLKIRTTKISNCFKKGHKIRITMTSSAKNFVFPNSNTTVSYTHLYSRLLIWKALDFLSRTTAQTARLASNWTLS